MDVNEIKQSIPRAQVFSIALKASNPSSITSAGTVDLIPGAGIYHRNALIQVGNSYNGATSLAICSRAEFCSNLLGCSGTISVNGVPTHTFADVGVCQLQYYQKFMNATFTSVANTAVGQTTMNVNAGAQTSVANAAGGLPVNTNQNIIMLGTGKGATDIYYQSFKLHHFIPFLFAPGQEYIEITDDFQITFNNVQLNGTLLTYQGINIPGTSGTFNPPSLSIVNSSAFYLKSTMKTEVGMPRPANQETHFLQKRFATGQCNDTFKVPPFCVSQFQTIGWVPAPSTGTYTGGLSILNVDVYDTDEHTTPQAVTVLKENVYIVNAPSGKETKVQLQAADNVSGMNYNSLFAVYEQLFENYTINQSVTSALTDTAGSSAVAAQNYVLYVGYQYYKPM